MAFLSMKTTDIQRTRQRILNLLATSIKTIDGRTGWYQRLGEERVGDVATAQGILLFSYLDRLSSIPLDDITKTLLQAQLTQQDNGDDGGWAFLSARESPTVEATTWAVSGLLAGGQLSSSDAIVRGEAWMWRNQNLDGGWGPRKPMESRIYTTYLACYCLLAINPGVLRDHPAQLRNTIQWVFGAQNQDGGWGERLGQNTSTVIHTAFAIITLIMLGIDPSDQKIRQGVRLLHHRWQTKDMWETSGARESYDIIRPTESLGHFRVTVEYFPTAWAILALLAAGESPFDEHLFDSVSWLISTQQSDGTWQTRNVEGKRMWAVHDGLAAIIAFMDKLVSINTVDRILLLDNVMVVSRMGSHGAIARQGTFASVSFLIIGAAFGIFGMSLFGVNTPFFAWLQHDHNLAWALLALYILSAVPLVKLRVMSWQGAMAGIVLPVILAIIFFLL